MRQPGSYGLSRPRLRACEAGCLRLERLSRAKGKIKTGTGEICIAVFPSLTLFVFFQFHPHITFSAPFLDCNISAALHKPASGRMSIPDHDVPANHQSHKNRSIVPAWKIQFTDKVFRCSTNANLLAKAHENISQGKLALPSRDILMHQNKVRSDISSGAASFTISGRPKPIKRS